MNINQARPAQKFYRIPMAVHRAILAGEIGRGEVMTLLKLAAYLWSDEPLEGTRAEFADVLCIEAQTFEAHVPALGRSGILSYTQPHIGLYRLNGLVPDDNTAAALRTAWKQAEQEWPAAGVSARNRYVWQSQRAEALKLALLKTGEALKVTPDESEDGLEASKLTLHVVDHHDHVLGVIEESGEQASKLTLAPITAPETSEPAPSPLCDPGFALLLRLYESEIGGTITAMVADEFRELWQACPDTERWRYAFRQSIGKRNRWAYVKAIILNPERKPDGNDKRGYNRATPQNANPASAPASGAVGVGVTSTSGASADITAWFRTAPQ